MSAHPSGNHRRPILVTGSHRSGTSWVGGLIAAAPGVGYLYEPFSPLHRPGTFAVPIHLWFQYVCAENEGPFRAPLERALGFVYDYGAELRAIRGPKDALRLVRDAARSARHRIARSRPLLKDPIALFSAEWIAETFGADVVVMIRNPLAFASSLKTHGMRHPFSHFLAQPLLMRDHLGPFEAEIRAFAETERDITEQAQLLWRIIHSVVETYRRRHPEWIFVRHEDISAAPVEGFREIFRRLGLPFTARVQSRVRAYSTARGGAGEPGAGEIRRDSRANLSRWKERLTPEEIVRIREAVKDLAPRFYPETAWP